MRTHSEITSLLQLKLELVANGIKLTISFCFGTDKSESVVDPSVMNLIKADKSDPGVLKNILMQQPLKVSHLLKDNLPKG